MPDKCEVGIEFDKDFYDLLSGLMWFWDGCSRGNIFTTPGSLIAFLDSPHSGFDDLKPIEFLYRNGRYEFESRINKLTRSQHARVA